MRRPTRTKIVCTIGPASDSEAVLNSMSRAGMNTARLNFSHGSPAEHLRRIRAIRKIDARSGRRTILLGDLEGPRIRIGPLKGSLPVCLRKNQKITLTQADVAGSGSVIPFDYKGPLKDIKAGCSVYIDDGNIALMVTGHENRALRTKVVIGGELKEQKGVNIPGARLKFGPISRKDISDIRFSAANRFDYVAQSFVRSADDIREVRSVLKRCGSRCGVIAKIENEDGIKNIDEIIEASDGVMVARGDMGVSVPIYKIPVIQKMIIRHCNEADKFVITATQMLESMTENRRPTLAEVTDVANAIIDGSNYVMLSAESAAGKYPVEAVEMMREIIDFTEGYLDGKADI